MNKETKTLTITPAKLAAFEGRRNHDEILDSLLDEIKSIKVREYLDLPDDVKTSQKHSLVAITKYLLEFAAAKQWNLAKVFAYTYVYNGAFWQQLDNEDMKHFLGRASVKMSFPDYDVRFYEFKDKLLKQFLSDAYLPAPPKNPDKVLINLQNATMEFTPGGWISRGFDPADFLTYQLPFAYNAEARCPTFDKYLLEVLPDENSRKVLQEFAGYIFTNLNLEKMLMLIGGGSNGKSVFFNIISALVGRQNMLNYTLGNFESEYNRAKLTNVLLNYSSEKGTEIKPDTFKALVSGEPLQAREPYGKPFTIFNKVRFMINANEFPKETEHTAAFFRRYLIIPFEYSIPDDKKDIELADKIIKNELSGVFNWLLEGLERIIHQKKFSSCAKVDKALEEFRRQSDSVALFIEEFNYQPSESNKESIAELYARYKAFCLDDGYKPFGKNNFSGRLEKKGFSKTRQSNGAIAFNIVMICTV